MCISESKDLPDEVLAQRLTDLANESIYDSTRSAQPDEVWNFQRGDGLEKAFTLAAIWKSRHPEDSIHLESTSEQATLTYGENTVTWAAAKESKFL